MTSANKATIVLEFEVYDRDDYPRFGGNVTIKGVTGDGLAFESVVRYDGKSLYDVVETLVRKESFSKTIRDVATAIMISCKPKIAEVKKPVPNKNIIEKPTINEPSFDDLGENSAPANAKVISHPPEWYESRDQYFANERKLLLKESYSGLRHYVTSAGIDVPVKNGADRIELVDRIIDAVIKKEEQNEANQQS
jgi:hypothetical protein